MSMGAPDDPRPAVWVGHVAMGVADVTKSREFFVKLGMRDVEPGGQVGIMELRAGTHLVLLPSEQPIGPATPAPFDLMVEDIDCAHEHCVAAGLSPTDIEEVPFHRAFTVREPSGYAVTVNSSHASGQPV